MPKGRGGSAAPWSVTSWGTKPDPDERGPSPRSLRITCALFQQMGGADCQRFMVVAKKVGAKVVAKKQGIGFSRMARVNSDMLRANRIGARQLRGVDWCQWLTAKRRHQEAAPRGGQK